MSLAGIASDALSQSIEIVRSRFAAIPKAAIILGSGLGAVADEIESPVAIGYADLPGFAKTTASGHRGQLICGKLDGVDVVAMAGRFHRYEGYSDDEVTFPVSLLAALGANRLIVSNAAGGLCPTLRVGDIVVIRDHIDLAKTAASGFKGLDRGEVAVTGELYDSQLIDVAMSAARRADFHAKLGVYLATSGPTYETRAEYRMMRMFGADVVGMSTAPEVRVAKRLGMQVLALSMVSNVARPDDPEPADHEDVLAAGRAAAFKLRAIVRETLAN
jgi:purine-nucleoside phosphorylase